MRFRNCRIFVSAKIPLYMTSARPTNWARRGDLCVEIGHRNWFWKCKVCYRFSEGKVIFPWQSQHKRYVQRRNRITQSNERRSISTTLIKLINYPPSTLYKMTGIKVDENRIWLFIIELFWFVEILLLYYLLWFSLTGK